MKKHYIILLIATLIIGTTIWSCKKDDLTLSTDFTNKINLPVPFLKSLKISARDLIEKLDSASSEYLFVDNDSLINFKYDTAFSSEWNDLVEFNELTAENNFDISVVKNKNVKVDYTFYDSILVSFIDGQRFDSVKIAEADLILDVQTPPSGITGNYTFRLPGLVKNGSAVEFTNTDMASVSEFHATENLNGSWMYFDQKDSNSYLIIEITVEVYPSGGTPSGSGLAFQMNITELKPDLIFGYFGSMDVIEETQEFPLDFFESLDLPAEIKFKAMSIDIGINNYFGVPLGVRVDSMVFVKEGEEPKQIFIDPIEEIKAAEYGDIIVPVHDSILINESTADGLMNAINSSPEKVYIELVGKINPKDIDTTNFIAADNLIEGDVTIKIPLWFNTTKYIRNDTMSFKIDTAQLKYVEDVTLKFNFDNSFPFDISAQAYVINEQGDSLGTVFEARINLIKSPDNPAIGTYREPKKSSLEVMISSSRLLELYRQDGYNIVLNSWVQVGDYDNDIYVKLLSTDFIDVGLKFIGSSGELN
ncbi:MAG: hypothetical protein JEZ09_12380 [Salinivirgaceae bacterium]|nr:hypothetical protein [Salinivirgaceae bacterium]